MSNEKQRSHELRKRVKQIVMASQKRMTELFRLILLKRSYTFF